jgi:flagellar biosynthesis protein FliQ
MEANEAIEITREAVIVMLELSLPVMLVTLIAGLAISFFQALTQIQEQALTTVPKIILAFVVLIFTLPFMLSQLTTYFETLADRIIGVGT